MRKSLWYKFTKNQVVRFLLSASIGFMVDIAAFYILYHNILTKNSYLLFSIPVKNSTLSLSISYVLGVITNFTITKFMVFSESKTSPAKQFSRFLLVAVAGFFANLGVLKILIQALGIYPPLARICAALSLFVASYFVHKFFSFSLSLRQHQHEPNTNNHPGN